MGDFKRLEVWRRSYRLDLSLYTVTKAFPRSEQLGLADQIRRAASSIPANIAEGCGRSGDRELARFLRIALGSASELEHHLLRARDLALLDPVQGEALLQEARHIGSMLGSLIRYLKRDGAMTHRNRSRTCVSSEATDLRPLATTRDQPRATSEPSTSDHRPSTSD